MILRRVGDLFDVRQLDLQFWIKFQPYTGF